MLSYPVMQQKPTTAAQRLPEALARKLVYLLHIGPDEMRGLEILVDDAIKRHVEADRARRLSFLRRIK